MDRRYPVAYPPLPSVMNVSRKIAHHQQPGVGYQMVTLSAMHALQALPEEACLELFGVPGCAILIVPLSTIERHS